jgi:hypothetical protein
MGYGIKTPSGYLTIMPGARNYSFTTNENFAYTYDSNEEAQQVINSKHITDAKIVRL